MKNSKWFKQLIIGFLCAGILSAVTAHAASIAADPVGMVYQFVATGEFQSVDPATGKITYVINADGQAPRVQPDGLVQSRVSKNDASKVRLSGAEITFDPYNPASPPPVINFTCAGCKLSFPDGSTLISDPGVPLDGRGLFIYGPVAPEPGKTIMTIRMVGCSGLREISGVGRLANKVGSICFNGVFDFDVSNPNVIPLTLTGDSTCTIVMHTPAVPLPPLQ